MSQDGYPSATATRSWNPIRAALEWRAAGSGRVTSPPAIGCPSWASGSFGRPSRTGRSDSNQRSRPRPNPRSVSSSRTAAPNAFPLFHHPSSPSPPRKGRAWSASWSSSPSIGPSATFLPGVRYIHLPHPGGDTRWRKSWAYNVGVSQARAEIIICHDADILVPVRYAREVVAALSADTLEAVFLQRFLFCLTAAHTNRVLSSKQMAASTAPDRIRQNWKGGTLAVRHEPSRPLAGSTRSS